MFDYSSPHLTKNRDNFLCSGPFLMFLGALESHGHAGSYVFDRTKKSWFFEKLQLKTFSDIFFITRFSKNIFRTKRKNHQIVDFSKIVFWKSSYEKMPQKVFGSNFSKINICIQIQKHMSRHDRGFYFRFVHQKRNSTKNIPIFL